MLDTPDNATRNPQLGRYQLLRRLAVGGMAEIYLARARGISGFEKLLVVKRILPQHALDPQLLRMFLDEARLTATLAHPNITQVYDVGTQGDTPFFAMEYVHGANLREIMNAAKAAATPADTGMALPLPHAIGIIAAAAAGLHHAHEKTGPDGQALEIVHRDVSPSNVLVTYDGSVKVSDFGIAKWAARRTRTQDGALRGKFAYMSPEQCRGQALDRRSDVFALGTLLYEVTTGHAPFQGESDYDILTKIVNQPAPAPGADNGDYPVELERIVLRALAPAPDQRYPTAQALQLALEDFAREQKLVVSPVALAAYMHQLFAVRIEAWQRAEAAGKSLGQHLAEEPGGGAAAVAAASDGRTATDAFAKAPAVALAADRRRRGVRAALAALVLVAVAGVAAVNLRGRGNPPTTTMTPPSSTPPSSRPSATGAAASAAGTHTTATTAPLPAPQPPTPGAAPPIAAPLTSTASAPPLSVERHQPPPSSEPSRPKRPGRVRPAAAASANRDVRGVETWDPDSPVPP